MKKTVCLYSLGLFFFLILIPFLIPAFTRTEIPSKPFPESRFEILDGVSLHYRLWEQEEPVGKVLFVHGLAGSTFSWRHNIIPLVEAGYMVLAVDLPGFGYSDRKRNIDHSQAYRARLLTLLLALLDETLESAYAKTPWSLVGHSMGGGTITAMALQDPSRIQSLFYVSGSVLGAPRSSNALLKTPLLNVWLARVGRLALINESRIHSLLKSAYGREPSEEEVQGYLKPLQIRDTEMTILDMNASSGPSFLPYLKDIHLPCYLIWGEKDTWVPLSEGEELRRSLHRAELLIIPQAFHTVHETHASLFNRWLLERLERDRL